MTWDKFDELFASFARPYSMYICSSAIAFSVVWSMIAGSDAVIVGLTIGAAVGLAGGQSLLRSVDKKTVATAETADKKTAATLATETGITSKIPTEAAPPKTQQG